MAKLPGLRVTRDDSNGDAVIVTAVLPEASGELEYELALGIILPQDAKRWQGEDKGGTVRMTLAQLRAFGKLVDQLDGIGKPWFGDYKRRVQEHVKAGRRDSEWPEPEVLLREGRYPARWGAVTWQLYGDAEEWQPGESDRKIAQYYISMEIDRNVTALLYGVRGGGIGRLRKHLGDAVRDFEGAYGSRSWFGDR